MILWELKLIIEFPHGWVILLPSATITHSNTPVMAGHIRISITQYCSGNLLRYADNMFFTDKALREQDKAQYMEQCDLKKKRWEEALKLLSTMDTLKGRIRGKAKNTHPMFK